MAGSTPLHKTVHWRKMRILLRMLCDYENIDYSSYDFDSINCRLTYGDLMTGTNVDCDIHDKSRSYFVSDNEYNIFEIPKIGKKGQYYGSFLVLIHNTSFDYWMFGKMVCSLNKNESIRTKSVKDKYFYDIFGHYSVSFDGKVFLTKTKRGNNIDLGLKSKSYCTYFDRKRSYHTNDSKILNKIGFKNNPNNLVDNKSVKIYNKRRKR